MAKRWLLVFLSYTAFATMVFCILFLAGPASLYENYGPRNLWAFHIVHGIVKCTIIYYFLIFWIFLPIARSGARRQTLLIKLPQLILFFALLTTYEVYIAFKTKESISQRQHLTFKQYMIWEVFIGTAMILISLAIAIIIEFRAKAVRQKKLEKEKLMAELSAIKYQINPHFLFNCLSFIYTKTVGQNQEVAHAVSLLSEIMRYALEQEADKQGLVPLHTEVTHMRNVIEMNQLRYNDRLRIRFLEEIDDPQVRIPPLVLITLLENAFKHGELTDEHHPLNLKLEVSRQRLCFYIHNKKRKGVKELSNGIGLDNVKQRLKLVYGIRHEFEIKEDENFYLAEIKINL